MKKCICSMLVGLAQLVAITSAVGAEMIVVDRRFVVPRQSLVVSIFKNDGQPVTIAYGPSTLEKAARVTCNDEWNWDKVEDLSLELARVISNDEQITVLEIASKHFSNCSNAKFFQGLTG